MKLFFIIIVVSTGIDDNDSNDDNDVNNVNDGNSNDDNDPFPCFNISLLSDQISRSQLSKGPIKYSSGRD